MKLALFVIAVLLVPSVAVGAAHARPDDVSLSIAALIAIYSAIALLTRALLASTHRDLDANASAAPRAARRLEFRLRPRRRFFNGPRRGAPAR